MISAHWVDSVAVLFLCGGEARFCGRICRLCDGVREGVRLVSRPPFNLCRFRRHVDSAVTNQLEAKRVEVVGKMRALKSQLEAGNDSNLLVWVLPKELATGQRPLRHHPLYAGSGVVIPV
jgi:hypothetical protein